MILKEQGTKAILKIIKSIDNIVVSMKEKLDNINMDEYYTKEETDNNISSSGGAIYNGAKESGYAGTADKFGSDLVDLTTKIDDGTLKIGTSSGKDSNLPVSFTVNIDDYKDVTNYKTLIGTVNHSTDGWQDIISLRHRNGNSDGINYGLYIRTPLTTDSSLKWRQQLGVNSWTDEKTILDSKNYSEYAASSSHTHDLSTMINGLSVGGSTPVDDDYYVSQSAGGGTTETRYYRRPVSALWTYIKSKADSVYLPLTGGTVDGYTKFTNTQFAPLQVERKGSYYVAGIRFNNDHGVLGYIGMSGSSDNASLLRLTSDSKTTYTVLDTGNVSNITLPDLTYSGIIKSTGTTVATSQIQAGTKLKIWTDNEGGNIQILSPNGTAYQFDAFSDSFLRLYYGSGSPYWVWNSDGDFNAPRLVVRDGMYAVHSGNYTHIHGSKSSYTNSYPHLLMRDFSNTLQIMPSTTDTCTLGHSSYRFGCVSSNKLEIIMDTSATVAYNSSVNPCVTFNNKAQDQGISFVYTDYDSYQKPSSITMVGKQGGEYFIAPNIKVTGNFYSSSGSIITSDRKKKYDINDMDENIVKNVIEGILPKTFRLKDGESGRLHYGIIAQDLEELLNDSNIDTKDFAALVKDYPFIQIIDGEEEVEYIDENNEKAIRKINKYRYENDYSAEPDYSVRYEEFIMILVKYCQMLNNRITELEK